MSSCRSLAVIFVFLALVNCVSTIPALDNVTVQQENQSKKLTGQIIAEDIEGNLVLEARDGQWYKIEKGDILERSADQQKFVPYTQDELIPILEKEYPPPFKVLKIKNYLIVYDTSTAYAQWCGLMLERLQAAFVSQWKKKGFDLHEPEFPLVAILYADRKDFIICTKREVGDIGEQIAAYYNFSTNRIVFSDLTGYEAQFDGPNRLTRAQTQEYLARPGAAQSVSTFVHEATHQIAFNSGMQQRYSACPLWLGEGIAMFYETPDFGGTRGWNASMKVNPIRLRDLRDFMQQSPKDAIRKLICEDKPLLDPDQMHFHYATAWAMVYYLNMKEQKNFVKYMKLMSGKKSFETDSPEKRQEEFEAIFGNNWNQFYKDFTKFVYSL